MKLKTAIYLFNTALLLLAVLAAGSPLPAEELLRIRVENRSGGLIEVSTDGSSFSAIGKVLRPATTCIQGFSAAAYIDQGTIAATAVHGIRIKTGEKAPSAGWEQRKPLMISLVPFEFATIPKGFGGHIPHQSGIYTDIPAGKTIFRSLAPYVGNKVFLQTKQELVPLPRNYSPAAGDVLVIVVSRPDDRIKEITFENRKGGRVTAVYADDRSELLALVDKPVEGTGRYDGTSYTGKGRINTSHPGVLTVSTAPVSPTATEGYGVETRGGFQIIPGYHARFQPGLPPQVMVVGPHKTDKPVLEGKPPLFAGCIGLSWDPVDEKHSFAAQVKIDDGDWESMPELMGKIDNSFTAAGLNEYFRVKGLPRDAVKGVTHIRILSPSDDKEFIAAEAKKAKELFTIAKASVNASGEDGVKTVSGNYLVSAPFGRLPDGSVIMFFIDGQVKKISAAAPHQLEWNTKSTNNGEHLLDIRAADNAGNIIKTATIKLMVKNN